MAGGTVGGFASQLSGGTFQDGFRNGAFSRMFNYCAHNGYFDRRFNWNDAVDQWRNGNGSTVTGVQASELNLADATYTKNRDGSYLVHTSIKVDAGAIYGTVTGDVSSDGMMTIRPDTYNFDIKNPFKAGTVGEFGRLLLRNDLNVAGLVVNGIGTPYRIEFTGAIPAPGVR